jgi:hypothetical protein
MKNFLKLIQTDTWQGYDIKDIKKFLGSSGYRQFNNWFSGKTGGMTADGEYCVYKYDFEKFCEDYGLLIG